MTGDPPIGTEDTIRGTNGDSEAVSQRERRLDDQFPNDGIRPGRSVPVAGGTLEDRADAIVRREGGVSDFSQAERADATPGYQVEDFPGQGNPEASADAERDRNRDDDALPDAAAGALGTTALIPGTDGNRSLA